MGLETLSFVPLIVLDLEWNQRYGRQQGIPSSLPQEIVDIGAVKLDASMRVAEQYQATVRPVVCPVMHRHVRRVTGISDADCRAGQRFHQAGASLAAFCGDHFTLCTWGPDDCGVLQRNLAYWMMPQGWLRGVVDAQKLYAILQGADKSRQVSLDAAMEALGISPRFPSHRALHDAHHTALVVRRLCEIAASLPEGDPRLRALGEAHDEYVYRLAERSAVLRTFHRSMEALVADEALFALHCPYCGAPMRPVSRRLCGASQQMLEQYAACERHGDFYARFLPQRTVSGMLSLLVRASPATEQQKRLFVERCAGQSAPRKRSRRRRPDEKGRAAGHVKG